MPKLLHSTCLAALSATLVLAAVPVVPCQPAVACPMLAALAAAGHGGHCEPQPSLDCCVHDRPLPAGTAGTAEAGQLVAAAALAAPAPAAVPAPPPPPARATTAPARGDHPVPLYTLHATLLI
jgi:hypothetical protein